MTIGYKCFFFIFTALLTFASQETIDIMNKRIITVIAIVFAAALTRLLPHAPNFTPIAAIALFGGAYITNRYLAIFIPLLAMLLSDALMGFNGWAFTEQVIAVYGSLVLISLMGASTLKGDKKALKIAGATVSSSVVFFIITNLAVWIGGFAHTPALYPLNGAGLLECYVAAIPFFQNSLMGDLFYSGVLFGGFYLASINIPALAENK